MRFPSDLDHSLPAGIERFGVEVARDMRDAETPENIELMSVDSIRRLARHTLVGRMLSWLP